MADVDINPLGKHDKTDEHPDKGETIPLTPEGVIGGGSTWEPEQETSLGGTSLRTKVLREHVEGLYQKLFKSMGQTPDAFRFDNFEIRDGKLYCRDKSAPLMNKRGELRSVGVIGETLCKEGLHDKGFVIPEDGKIMA